MMRKYCASAYDRSQFVENGCSVQVACLIALLKLYEDDMINSDDFD